MAKKAEAAATAAVDVTYVPKDGDAATVVWNRIKFVANVPTPVKDAEIVEKAKANPWFTVAGFEKKAVAKPAVKDAEAYRAHAIAWINAAKTSQELLDTWAAEAEMREEFGVGSDDIDFLNAIYEPKLADLKKAESDD